MRTGPLFVSCEEWNSDQQFRRLGVALSAQLFLKELAWWQNLIPDVRPLRALYNGISSF